MTSDDFVKAFVKENNFQVVPILLEEAYLNIECFTDGDLISLKRYCMHRLNQNASLLLDNNGQGDLVSLTLQSICLLFVIVKQKFPNEIREIFTEENERQVLLLLEFALERVPAQGVGKSFVIFYELQFWTKKDTVRL